jgi:hypothetical protein
VRSLYRRAVPAPLRTNLWIRRQELRRDQRAPTASVRAAMDLSPLKGIRADGSRSVWAVGLVKDEADIIETTIDHLFAEGVERVVVAENGSSDGTPTLLRDLARRHALTVVSDRLAAYYQRQKVTRLARAAARAGAGWIVPFDADELWFAETGTLADFLANTDADIVRAEVWNYVPTAADDASEKNPVRRITHRQPMPAADPKFAFRAHRRAMVLDGNIQVFRPSSRPIGGGLRVAHFPYRAAEQFVAKMRNGKRALDATNLDASVSSHWRSMGSASEEDLLAWWRSLVDDGTPLPGDSWGVGGPLVVDPITSTDQPGRVRPRLAGR